MVGYILGLGDRHPSNLMMNRDTGNVVHIDFGDCFEVAMQRERYPERIPFRLTRMLVNAMEVGSVEGTFRTTCEQVMRVLRENSSSLTSVLESFVYDPLASWRILKKKHRERELTTNTISHLKERKQKKDSNNNEISSFLITFIIYHFSYSF